LRGGIRKTPGDIDIFIPIIKRGELIKWLEETPSVPIWYEPLHGKLFFILVHQSNTYFFDVTLSFQYATDCFRFNLDDLISEYSIDLEDSDTLTTLRYFLMRRKTNKAIEYVLKNRAKLAFLPKSIFYTERFTEKS